MRQSGRPQIGEEPRVILSASVSAEIAALVRLAGDRAGLSRSQVVSDALEAYRVQLRRLVGGG